MPKKNLAPKRIDKRRDELVQKAIDLKNVKDFQGAIDVLEEIVRAYPDYAPGWGLLGGIYLYNLDRPEEATRCFEETTRLSPRSETASLGLFHSLWGRDRYDAAIAEMKRFQSISHSDDYAEIAAELKEKGIPS
jgi:tetratricopeptide (TPR) repeat protein